ncbi:unnamed protein product [Ilex paraguariensis]|uniref:Uncharacterized protein n=1 Tax=Ilex paraguariensis TaxID=185542 RepID=A0ABC8S0F6_9AQUA
MVGFANTWDDLQCQTLDALREDKILSRVMKLAWGLQLNQQRFVWVVRQPTEKDASLSYSTAGIGGSDDLLSYLPDGFITRTHTVGLIHNGPHKSMATVWGAKMVATILTEEGGVAIRPKEESLNELMGREEVERKVMEGEWKLMKARAKELQCALALAHGTA